MLQNKLVIIAFGIVGQSDEALMRVGEEPLAELGHTGVSLKDDLVGATVGATLIPLPALLAHITDRLGHQVVGLVHHGRAFLIGWFLLPALKVIEDKTFYWLLFQLLLILLVDGANKAGMLLAIRSSYLARRADVHPTQMLLIQPYSLTATAADLDLLTNAEAKFSTSSSRGLEVEAKAVC